MEFLGFSLKIHNKNLIKTLKNLHNLVCAMREGFPAFLLLLSLLSYKRQWFPGISFAHYFVNNFAVFDADYSFALLLTFDDSLFFLETTKSSSASLGIPYLSDYKYVNFASFK